MREQRVLVGEHQAVTGIELARLGQAEIRPQQIGHGALAEPFAMQPPLAAGFDQSVGDQHLQNLIPARSLPTRGQALRPEPVELQFSPQTGPPTSRRPTVADDAGAFPKFAAAPPRRRPPRPRNGPPGTRPASESCPRPRRTPRSPCATPPPGTN